MSRQGRIRQGVVKWTPPDLPRWYDSIPKAVLFVIARQMAATVAGECDNLSLGERGILDEWFAQYRAGNVPQKPTAAESMSKPEPASGQERSR